MKFARNAVHVTFVVASVSLTLETAGSGSLKPLRPNAAR